MSNNSYDLLHPYRECPVSDEFIGSPEYGSYTIVLELEVFKKFLLNRERAMAALNDDGDSDSVQPLHYSTQSFIDSLVSAPKSYAICKKEEEEFSTEYVAMKEFCTRLRLENLKLMEEIVRLKGGAISDEQPQA